MNSLGAGMVPPCSRLRRLRDLLPDNPHDLAIEGGV